MTTTIKSEIEILSDATLGNVAGGLNPQPLPPGPDSFRVMHKINFGLSQFALPALNLYRLF